jgi:hypothetical protein
MRRTAFTLLELLVSTAIVIVLTGLLMGALHRVREAANCIGCVNNLRSIGMAAHQYHLTKRRFPGDGGNETSTVLWQLAPYTESLDSIELPTYRCLSRNRKTPAMDYGYFHDLKSVLRCAATITCVSTAKGLGQTAMLAHRWMGVPYRVGSPTVNDWPGVLHEFPILDRRSWGTSAFGGPHAAAPYLFCDGSVRCLMLGVGAEAYSPLNPSCGAAMLWDSRDNRPLLIAE